MAVTARGNTRPGQPLPRDLRYQSRLLYHFRAADLLLQQDPTAAQLKALTGNTPSFTRATAGGSIVDAFGRPRAQAQGVPRIEMYDLDGDGFRETPGIVTEDQRVNLVLQSENFGTTWLTTGTVTRTAAAKTVGDLVLDLLGDTDGAAQGFYRQVITFTGNGVKSIIVHVSKGTILAAAGAYVSVRDTTAAADRLDVAITWNGAVPVCALTAGTLLRTVALAEDLYRLEFQTTAGLLAANVNEVRVGGAYTAAQQGNVYAGGIQAENAVFPSTYSKTTTATVTKNLDSWNHTHAFQLNNVSDRDDFTAYALIARPNHADLAGTIGFLPGVFSISATNARLGAYFDSTTRFLFGLIRTGAGDATASKAIPAGASIEVCVQYKDLNVAPAVAIDVGGGPTALTTGAAGVFTGFGDALITPGMFDAALGSGVIALKVARGIQALTDMRVML